MAEVFELNSDKLDIKINGTPYSFNEPSVDDVKSLHKKLKDLEAQLEENAELDVSYLDVYKDFFAGLELAPEALSKLSAKKILELFAFAVGTKKN
jgi:hypothetical protein